MPIQIFATSSKSQMECYRRSLKDKLGDTYESAVAPYAGLIAAQYWRCYNLGIEKGLYETAQELVGIIRGKMKREGREPSPWITATLMAAALEVEDHALLERFKKPDPPKTDDLPPLPDIGP